MKSPFPGMDPFIEAFDLWGDFHDSLIGELARILRERVPSQYVVRLGSRSYVAVEEDEPDRFSMRPDISVKRRTTRKKVRRSRSASGPSGTTATLEPPIVM